MRSSNAAVDGQAAAAQGEGGPAAQLQGAVGDGGAAAVAVVGRPGSACPAALHQATPALEAPSADLAAVIAVDRLVDGERGRGRAVVVDHAAGAAEAGHRGAVAGEVQRAAVGRVEAAAAQGGRVAQLQFAGRARPCRRCSCCCRQASACRCRS